MEKLLSNHEIFQITIGDPKTGFKFRLGQDLRVNNREVSIVEIKRDENNHYYFGNVAFIIYVEYVSGGAPFVWRSCEGQPVDIVYKAPVE